MNKPVNQRDRNKATTGRRVKEEMNRKEEAPENPRQGVNQFH